MGSENGFAPINAESVRVARSAIHALSIAHHSPISCKAISDCVDRLEFLEKFVQTAPDEPDTNLIDLVSNLEQDKQQLSEKVSELEREKTALTDEVATLRDGLETVSQSVDSSNFSADNEHESALRLMKDKTELQENLAMADERIAGYIETIERLGHELNQQRDAYDHKIHALETENERLGRKSDQQRDDFRAKIKALEIEDKRLREVLAEKHDCINQCQSEIDNFESKLRSVQFAAQGDLQRYQDTLHEVQQAFFKEHKKFTGESFGKFVRVLGFSGIDELDFDKITERVEALMNQVKEIGTDKETAMFKNQLAEACLALGFDGDTIVSNHEMMERIFQFRGENDALKVMLGQLADALHMGGVISVRKMINCIEGMREENKHLLKRIHEIGSIVNANSFTSIGDVADCVRQLADFKANANTFFKSVGDMINLKPNRPVDLAMMKAMLFEIRDIIDDAADVHETAEIARKAMSEDAPVEFKTLVAEIDRLKSIIKQQRTKHRAHESMTSDRISDLMARLKSTETNLATVQHTAVNLQSALSDALACNAMLKPGSRNNNLQSLLRIIFDANN